MLSNTWVPEGSLAGFFVRHHLALELVSGDDFWCKLMSRSRPVAAVCGKTNLKRTPGSFKRTNGSFKRTPGSFKRTPGPF